MRLVGVVVEPGRTQPEAEGGFGTIYRGRMSTQRVAIKRLRALGTGVSSAGDHQEVQQVSRFVYAAEC